MTKIKQTLSLLHQNSKRIIWKPFKVFKIVFFLLASIFILNVFVSTFPVANDFNHVIPLYMILFYLLYLVVSIKNDVLNKTVNYIYVFLNFIIYFFLYNMGVSENHGNAFTHFFSSEILLSSSLGGLVILAALFFFVRDKFTCNEEKSFLGIDLLITILVPISFLSIYFGSGYDSSVITVTTVMAYVFYIWYRIYSVIFEQYYSHLFYASFGFSIVPLLAIILMF